MAEVYNIYMNNLEISLNKIAETILHLDEASLASLWEKYKSKVENFSNTKEWEKAVIIFTSSIQLLRKILFSMKK